jgi:methylglutaconyl-CoA hydratase
MADELVRFERDGRGVVWITLARPARRNAFDAEIIAGIVAALGQVDLSARAVVLAAEGDAFCAGADLNWMQGMVEYGLEQNMADSRALAEMFRALDGLPMPLLARVQGPAIGGGAGLVAMADIAVASTEAVFGFSEVRLGIIPAVISPYVVRKIGAGYATALFVTGMRFDAARAQQIGLVREVAGRPIDQVRDMTIERIAALRVSAEGQEGMRAFLERRPARWDS